MTSMFNKVLKVNKKTVSVKPTGRGILDIVGKLPPFKIPKGKTVDDLIHEATMEVMSDVFPKDHG